MTISTSQQNRPLKFGGKDRREFIVEDTEVALVAINNTDANPIFLGRAKTNTTLSEPKWQIRKITYDSNGGVTRVQWPENPAGIGTSDYDYIWSSDAVLTITGITKDNPAVVTVSAIGDLQNGDQIVIQSVAGMTEVNFTGSNIYTVANIVGSTFELQGIDSSAFTTYTSGGTVEFGQVVNYTYV